jgi:hypothetical protein
LRAGGDHGGCDGQSAGDEGDGEDEGGDTPHPAPHSVTGVTADVPCARGDEYEIVRFQDPAVSFGDEMLIAPQSVEEGPAVAENFWVTVLDPFVTLTVQVPPESTRPETPPPRVRVPCL